MAYNPTNWVSGDVITAEKLNKVEKGIEDAPGYSVESVNDYFAEEQTVTTNESGSASMNVGTRTLSDFSSFTNGTVKVDGTEYIGTMVYHNGWHLTSFPEEDPILGVEEDGTISFREAPNETHTVSVYFVTETVTTGTDFTKAVKSLTKQYVRTYSCWSREFTSTTAGSVGNLSLDYVYHNIDADPPQNYDLAIVRCVFIPSGLSLNGWALEDGGLLTIGYRVEVPGTHSAFYCGEVDFIKFGEPFE